MCPVAGGTAPPLLEEVLLLVDELPALVDELLPVDELPPVEELPALVDELPPVEELPALVDELLPLVGPPLELLVLVAPPLLELLLLLEGQPPGRWQPCRIPTPSWWVRPRAGVRAACPFAGR